MVIDLIKICLLIVGAQAKHYLVQNKDKYLVVETASTPENQLLSSHQQRAALNYRPPGISELLHEEDSTTTAASNKMERRNKIAEASTKRQAKTTKTSATKPAEHTIQEFGAIGDCKCGLVKKYEQDPANRIVGGMDSKEGEFPWMARITLNGQGWCGGSLIGAQWVLTARHCTLINDEIEAEAKELMVTLGDHDLNKLGDTELRLKVIEIVNHPNYTIYPNVDFALLKLERPVNFMKETHVSPICLTNDVTETYEDETSKATGWGKLAEEGNYATILQKVDLKIMSNDQCIEKMPGLIISEFMICASMPGTNKDACQGDSGGPLISSKGGNGFSPGGNYELVGVNSWGYGCGTHPGVFARVTTVLDWIHESVGGNLNTCPRT